MVSIYVGIDVSKNSLDVYVRSLNISRKFSNDESGIKELTDFLVNINPSLILLEATGRLEQDAAISLATSSLRVSIINPKRARDFARAANLAKTDKIDAAMLADFACAFVDKLDLMLISDKFSVKIKDLSTRRKQLLKMQSQEKNRLRWIKDEIFISSINTILEVLNNQIAEIDLTISKLISENDSLKKKSEILQSVPGIGKVTSNILIASLPELGSLTKKKIAKLVGVAPINNDSGEFKGKRSIKGGRYTIRAALFMATLTAIKHNIVIKDFYNKLLSRGKAKKVALVACMHKLIHIVNAMLAKQQKSKNT